MNAKMPELARCFERAGFTNVKTVLGSGNVVFSAPRSATRAVEERAFAAMQEHLDRTFPVIVRTGAALAALVADDPWQRLELAPGSKQVVTFLARPAPANIALPAAVDGARLLAIEGTMVLSAYVPHPTKGPVFMALLEKTFGKEITTRTWDTVKKLVRAASVV